MQVVPWSRKWWIDQHEKPFRFFIDINKITLKKKRTYVVNGKTSCRICCLSKQRSWQTAVKTTTNAITLNDLDSLSKDTNFLLLSHPCWRRRRWSVGCLQMDFNEIQWMGATSCSHRSQTSEVPSWFAIQVFVHFRRSCAACNRNFTINRKINILLLKMIRNTNFEAAKTQPCIKKQYLL